MALHTSLQLEFLDCMPSLSISACDSRQNQFSLVWCCPSAGPPKELRHCASFHCAAIDIPPWRSAEHWAGPGPAVHLPPSQLHCLCGCPGEDVLLRHTGGAGQPPTTSAPCRSSNLCSAKSRMDILASWHTVPLEMVGPSNCRVRPVRWEGAGPQAPSLTAWTRRSSRHGRSAWHTTWRACLPQS